MTPTLPRATYHPAGCWRCPSPVPYGARPARHTDATPSCHRRYIGSDGLEHRCTRPFGHPDACRAGDYR